MVTPKGAALQHVVDQLVRLREQRTTIEEANERRDYVLIGWGLALTFSVSLGLVLALSIASAASTLIGSLAALCAMSVSAPAFHMVAIATARAKLVARSRSSRVEDKIALVEEAVRIRMMQIRAAKLPKAQEHKLVAALTIEHDATIAALLDPMKWRIAEDAAAAAAKEEEEEEEEVEAAKKTGK